MPRMVTSSASPRPLAKHVLGSHPPETTQTSLQSGCVVTVHVPSSAQQEPVGCGHVFGVHTPANVQVLGAMQSACVVTEHVPSSAQQEPVGCGHVFGVHTPADVQVLGAMHAACVVTEHVPSSAQQEPVGCGHVFGVHTPARVHVLGEVQATCVVTVQVPAGAQQEPVVAAVIVKFTFEISKKTLPAASTLIRASVVAVPGRVTACEPSFGVPATSTVGNVYPPSVESRMLTFAQLIGVAVVLATFHVTVCCDPPAQLTAVLGEVTRNGPAEATVNEIKSFATPTPPVCVSRTVTLNESVRA